MNPEDRFESTSINGKNSFSFKKLSYSIGNFRRCAAVENFLAGNSKPLPKSLEKLKNQKSTTTHTQIKKKRF